MLIVLPAKFIPGGQKTAGQPTIMILQEFYE